MAYERWNANVILGVGFALGFVACGTESGIIAQPIQHFAIGNLAEWTTGIAAVGAIIFGVYQLKEQTRQQRLAATLTACDRYDSDPILSSAKRTLRRLESSQEIGRQEDIQDESLYACHCLFNYFEGISIGLAEGLYVRAVVEDHLLGIMSEWYDSLIALAMNNSTIKTFINSTNENNDAADYGGTIALIIEWRAAQTYMP